MRKLPSKPKTNTRRNYTAIAKLFRKLVSPAKAPESQAYLLAAYLSKVELREVA